ncbi:MAG TPA: GNAT family N-acetyltransferase [Streptosporangiaceae bacterium]|nr:GNAT family N-acetyltransferase [Streptosporangiaceae bacterium]
MIVRPARQSELGAVGELRVDAYNAQNLLSLNPPYADTLRTLGTDGRGEVLVAVDGAGLLGTIMLDPWHPNSEVARGPEEAEIRGLAVAPAAQGRGVGARLVRAVIDRATERGARLLLLSTLPIMAAAQRLYVASGFTRLPDRDWSPRPGVTLLAFCRTLDE